MPIKTFPIGGTQRARLPKIAAGSPPTWRVVMPRERVTVLGPQTYTGADADGYFPIQAVYVECSGCKAGECAGAVVFPDDALSWCSVYLDRVFAEPDAPQAGFLPFAVDWRINMAAACITEPLLRGTFVVGADPADPFGMAGLLGGVISPLCTQYELWARARPIDDDAPAYPVGVRLQFVVGRLGGALAGYRGHIAGGGDLPVVNPP